MILVTNTQRSRPVLPNLFPLFSTASVVILFGLAGIYFYIYKFYDDEIYRLISIAWIGNALYMVLEGLFSIPVEHSLRFALSRYLFAQVSFIPLYLASFCERDGVVKLRRASIEIGLWFIWILLTLFGGHSWARAHYGIADANRIFVVSTTGGIPYAFWTLLRVGTSVKGRLNHEVHGNLVSIFPATFYFWAFLQPLYLLRLS